jgi:hypothetical protein
MDIHQFTLHPFPDSTPIPAIEISGTISRSDVNTLAIGYSLSGDLQGVKIPPRGELPQRTIGLWEGTCFEFFIGVKDSPSYWEVNLSPTGDWNVFHLDNYRQGLREETAFKQLPLTIEVASNRLSLSLELDLHAIDLAERDLEIAITTVIAAQTGTISYWAVTHTGTEADFHRRDSFTIDLARI